MQPVLQGYLGLIQGEKLHLYSIKNDREITMVIYFLLNPYILYYILNA